MITGVTTLILKIFLHFYLYWLNQTHRSNHETGTTLTWQRELFWGFKTSVGGGFLDATPIRAGETQAKFVRVALLPCRSPHREITGPVNQRSAQPCSVPILTDASTSNHHSGFINLTRVPTKPATLHLTVAAQSQCKDSLTFQLSAIKKYCHIFKAHAVRNMSIQPSISY